MAGGTVSILVINPIIETRYEEVTRLELEAACPSDAVFEVVSIAEGPAMIETREDERFATAGILARVSEGRDRCDAMVVNCFADPAVREARAIVDVPVVGPNAASLHVAAQLGRRMSIVTITESVVDMIRELAADAGLDDRLTSVRASGLHVDELEGADAATRVAEECVAAVRDDSADVVVLGCTGMAALAGEVKDRLKSACPGVPLVVPATAAFLTAYVLARMQSSA